MLKRFILSLLLVCGCSAFLYSGEDLYSSESMIARMQNSQESSSKKSPKNKGLKHSSKENGYFATLSYLYWYGGEDGMELATTAVYKSATGFVVPSCEDGKVAFPDFDYSSGFKVGFGATKSNGNLDIRADYTYYRQTSHSHKSRDVCSEAGVGVYLLSNWFVQPSSGNQSIAAGTLRSKWHLGIDWLDVSVARSFSFGKGWAIKPFGGLRASWIRQTLDLKAEEIYNIASVSNPATSHNHSNSWGIGPRAGLGGEWEVWRDFTCVGSLGSSLLFTQYTHVKHSESQIISGGCPSSYSYHNYNCLRPMTEIALGLGWNKSFAEGRRHLLLTASYEFNYLWAQNMMRKLNDLFIWGNSAAANDLYLHGLTLSGRFDF